MPSNWITDQHRKNPDKPWFVWFAFNLSHITGQQNPNPMAVPNKDTHRRNRHRRR